MSLEVRIFHPRKDINALKIFVFPKPKNFYPLISLAENKILRMFQAFQY